MKIKNYLSQSPLFAFYQIHGMFMGNLQRFLAREGVHFLQAFILTAFFFEAKGVRPQELIQLFQISKSSLSHALRDLEKKGYIKRFLCPQDARGYLFELTPLGKKKTLLFIRLFDVLQEGFEKELDPPALGLFLDQLQKMVQINRRLLVGL